MFHPRRRTVAMLLAIHIPLRACGTLTRETGRVVSDNPKMAAGAVMGAAAGGLIAAASGLGSADIVGGAFFGGLLGGAIGSHLDRSDGELAAGRPMCPRAFPSGTRRRWGTPTLDTLAPLRRRPPISVPTEPLVVSTGSRSEIDGGK